MSDRKQYTSVRFSHLTRHSAPDSVVREQNDWLAFVKDITAWPTVKMEELQAVTRVKQHLGIYQRLLMPPEDEFDDDSRKPVRNAVLPIVRFPSWTACTSCGLLVRTPWVDDTYNLGGQLVCTCRQGLLKQVTWCAVSSYGDLTDVRWHYIAHRQSGSGCRQDRSANYLKIEGLNTGAPIVRCSKCRVWGRFGFADFKLPDHYQLCKKMDPVEEKSINYTIVEVNDPGVFMPVNDQALVIPPESNIDRNSLQYKLSINSQIVAQIKSSKRPLERKN